jgi:hypothetical protein
MVVPSVPVVDGRNGGMPISTILVAVLCFVLF